MYCWKAADNGKFELYAGGVSVMSSYAKAAASDGRQVDSRTARLVCTTEIPGGLVLCYQAENGLMLTEKLTTEQGTPIAQCTLSSADGNAVETNHLVPLVISSGSGETIPLWKSLWTRMLAVPYDNTMWLRLEALPMRAGRISYDLTVLFNPESREGLLAGAIDFDCWKNALMCSAYDARNLEAICGISDAGSHDTLPHGTIIGKEVSSSRFCVLFGEDYRQLLEAYGDVVKAQRPLLAWDGNTPFGFNSWAGLAFRLNEELFAKTGRFMREKLVPNSYHCQGVSYVNLDAGWSSIGEDGLQRLRDEQHANDQLAGIYDAPFAFFGRDVKAEIPGVPGHCFEEILLKDASGALLPRVDGAIPMDVTHPLWKRHTAWKLDRFVNWGYEYVKVDFMTHGGMEGVHADPVVRTGRQALNMGYQFVCDCLSPQRIGRPFFISLSIAPLFPNGYGHARRFSCDAFGTNEDIEYVLNAQTYGWWQNQRLYAFNDPDHIVLHRAFCMDRESTIGEARARYTTAAIAGGVMMLSDDYSEAEARKRTELLACNAEVNAVAASRTAFVPVESADSFACHAFTAQVDGKTCLALFALKAEGETVSVSCARAAIPEGVYRDLWTGEKYSSQNGVITWQAKACDALLLVHES